MKHVRDFHSQSWNNPFFAKQAGLSRLKKILIAIGGCLLMAGFIYLFVYSSLLRVRTIDVAGNETISADDIRSSANEALSGYRKLVMPNDYLPLLDVSGIKNIILAKFSILRNVSIEKKFQKLLIIVEERKPTFRLFIGDKSYLLDQEGIGMRETTVGEGDVLIALAQDGLLFVSGSKLLPDGWPQCILNLHKYFATLTGVRDQIIWLGPVSSELHVTTNEGWYVVIDPKADIKTQISSLSSALLGKFNFEERKKLEFIDVRFGDRIFYKWK